MTARRFTHIGLPASVVFGAALMTLFVAVLLAGTALAAAKPGKPTAKAPKGSITTTKPTFTWSKSSRATRYEVRVYQGSKLLVKKTGIAKLSWKSSTVLLKGVGLTWKVRAVNAGGDSAWSKGSSFKVVTLAIGDAYGGGKVAYILQSTDPGYKSYAQHGLIVATVDQSTGIRWYKGANVVTGATGTGSANTTKIIAVQGKPVTSYAAGLARAYRGGGHTDWYLPSRDELHRVYINQVAIGGSWTSDYWTSSELGANSAWHEFFTVGDIYSDLKSQTFGVRAVRSF